MVTCPSPFKPMELKCVTDTVSAAKVAWGNRPASAVRNKMALISSAFVDTAPAIHSRGHRRISPIVDVASAVNGSLETPRGAQSNMPAAIDCRLRVVCIDGTYIDMPAALDGNTDRVLTAEVAFNLDLAAAGNGHALDPRRHDLDFEIVMPRAVLVTGVDDELAVALHVKFRELRAS